MLFKQEHKKTTPKKKQLKRKLEKKQRNKKLYMCANNAGKCGKICKNKYYYIKKGIRKYLQSFSMFTQVIY